MLRTYKFQAVDPIALAAALNVDVGSIALRLGVTSDWTRRLARDARHAERVRRVVLEIALERDRLAQMVLR